MRFYKIEITKIPCEKRRKEYYEEKSNCNHLNCNDGCRNACRMWKQRQQQFFGSRYYKEASATEADGSTDGDSNAAGGDFSGQISVISREDGSGTRGAFIELFGVEEKTMQVRK